MNRRFFLPSHTDMVRLGEAMGNRLSTGASVALRGELAAGKTTFVKGLAAGIGVPAAYPVTSPTFNIINEYPAGNLTLIHADLYRLDSVHDLDYIGLEDLLTENGVLAVEWPGILDETGFKFDLDLCFEPDVRDGRKVRAEASGEKGAYLLKQLVFK